MSIDSYCDRYKSRTSDGFFVKVKLPFHTPNFASRCANGNLCPVPSGNDKSRATSVGTIQIISDPAIETSTWGRKTKAIQSQLPSSK